MRNFYLTVFNKSGKKLLDEFFTAKDNEEAIRVSAALLAENGYESHTHRCVTSNGKLILFHR